MTNNLFRREVLESVTLPHDRNEVHAGLWLDRYLESDYPGSKEKPSAKQKLTNEVTGIGTSKAYERYFERWQATLIALCNAENLRLAETSGRLAINLGAKGVLETSIALHHTYGTPYIPGSALKGLAAHYVTTYFEADLKKDGDDLAWNREMRRYLFGDTTSAGYVTFYDALYVPRSGKGLVPDVVTVHHPDYYQGTKPEYYKDEKLRLAPPADWDSPVPIPFISANGNFLIALSGPTEWVDAAFKILELALEREGIGAKTSSGYGRMIIEQKRAPKEIPAGHIYGRVKEFGDVFGKIQPEGGGSEIFVHKNELHPSVESLQPGQRVAYRKGIGKNNKEQALDVIPVE